MTIVDTRRVCGGVDTHADFHVAAALDHIGGLLGIETFETTEAGYRRLLEWLRGWGEVIRVGVEGTGSYGAGLVRHLHADGVEVVEVDRPNRQLRRREGKSDPTDAVAAARAALSGQADGEPKRRNGPVEQMRVILVARRSARDQRIQTLNQIRHLVMCGPEPVRRRYQHSSPSVLVKQLCATRPRPQGNDPVTHTTVVTLRDLARRVRTLDHELDTIGDQLTGLVAATAPSLLTIHGLAAQGAATLLVAAGDNPERIRSEAAWAHLCGTAPIPASSGKTTRYRLNRGGNRHANAVLHQIVLTRMANDPRTRAYVTRHRQKGRTNPEIMRMLKRYVAREIYKHLPRPHN